MVTKKSVFILSSICLASFLLFLIILILVNSKSNWLSVRDQGTCLRMYNSRKTLYNYVFVIISYLGETKTIVALTIILLVLPNRAKVGLPLLVVILESLIFCVLFKSIVMRDRPVGWFLTEPVLNYTFPSGPSFPSGHAQNAVVFWLSLAILIAYDKKKIIGELIVANATIFCFLMCFSRVYLCVHFLSDVLAGVSLAIFLIGTNVLLYELYKSKSKYYKLNKYKFENKLYT